MKISCDGCDKDGKIVGRLNHKLDVTRNKKSDWKLLCNSCWMKFKLIRKIGDTNFQTFFNLRRANYSRKA